MMEWPETDEGLKRCLIASLVAHFGLLVFLFFGMPSLFKPDPGIIHPYVPIDVVDIGELTNLNVGKEETPAPSNANTEKPKETPPEQKTPPPPTPPKETPKAPETPKQAEAPEPEAIALKNQKKPDQKPKPPEPPKEKPQADPLASVLKNVAKIKDASKASDKTSKDKQENAPTTPSPNKTGTSGGSNAPSLGDRLTISEEDALRRQISQCWNMPVGAKNSEDLIVEVLIDVNPDRTVREAKIVDQVRLATDGYFRAAAEAALRALRHPNCNPLQLNPDKYEQWKTIRFTFDPRDMM